MKIWLLSSNRWNSAVTEYALSSARALQMRGHDILFTPLAGSAAERRASDLGLPVRPLKHFSVGKVIAHQRIDRAFKPKVILTFGGPETFLARFCKKPTIRVRGIDIDSQVWLAEARHKVSNSHVNAIVTPSRVLAEKVRTLAGSKQVVPVVLGCDTKKFQRSVAQYPKKPPNALIFGRFDPVKGHEQFLAVWRLVRAQQPNATLRIVGEPANVSVEQIEKWVLREGLRIGQDVEIVSVRVQDVADLLSSASIGVVPSIGSEIIGRVAEEFLLCGTPVLVSGVGSLEEVIFDPTAGASWRGLSDQDIAEKIIEWLRRSDLESEADKQNRARCAAELFSLETMGISLEKLIITLS